MSKEKKQKTGIPRLLEMAGQRKTLMIVGASLSTVAALFQLAPYLAVYNVMTELLRNAADISQVDTSYMTFWALFGIIGLVVCYVFMYVGGMIGHIAAYRTLYGIRVKLSEHISGLPLGWFSRNSIGKVKQIAEQDVEQIELFIAHQFPDMISTIAVIVFTHATFHDGYATSADGRIRLAEHIRKLPLGFLMSKDSGELGNTMMNDFSQIEEGVTHILPQLISGIIVAFLALFGMAFADWRMALAMFAGLPVTFLILWGVRVIDRKRGAAHTKARIEQTNRLQEYLTGMKVIKAYNLRGANFKKLERAFYNFMKESIKLEGVSGPFYLIAVAFLQIGLSMITMAGTYLLLGGTLELPMFIIFLLVGSRVFDPLVSAITQLPVFT